MSAVLSSLERHGQALGAEPLRHLWQSWRSLRAAELGLFVLLGCVLGGMNLLALDDPTLVQRSRALVVSEMMMPMLFWLLLLATWLPADRSAPASPHRVRRLVTAVLLATVLAALLGPLLLKFFGLSSVMEAAYAHKGKAPPSWLAMFVANSVSALLPAALVIPVLEMAGRHRRSEAAVAVALEEQARLARTTLESRLAAMQAQVEPQFLFDVLVDIERLYDAPAGAGGDRVAAHAQMDRLITYLRVALPKLREAGSTLGAEIDLLCSYLDLVQAMHDGEPRFVAELAPALRRATFHPMLLLPLVQRAVRSGHAMPSRIELQAEMAGNSLRLVLTFASPGLCEGDDELQRLRERLQVLYDGRASLICEDLPASDAGSDMPPRLSRFTMDLPA
ncbi:histidine kinase [Piscinibacter sakaiensis]|uniref:histidine kinase n=1 Tax=Piscinibacter sakaiensis TaxID=1547922 RepID=UPI003AB0A9B5